MADFSRGSTVVVSPKLQQSYAHLPSNISHYTSLPPIPSLPARNQEQKLPSSPITLPRLRIDSVTGAAHFNNASPIPLSLAIERPYASANNPLNLNGFSVKVNWNFQLAAPHPCDAEKPPIHHLTSRNSHANVYPVYASQASSMEGEGGNGQYGAPSQGIPAFQQLGDEAEAVQQVGSGVIVADNLSVDDDAGYESDSATTASTSVSSSIWDFSFENGRRYHKFREGRYNFPNDDVEQEREDMKHAMVKMLCQKLHFAPLDNPHEILDLGTGTGIWAIEMGDTYPSANVLGIDLSPIQPQWVPPNVRFMVDDVESPWLHPKNHFDYIHSRHMIMAIKDWDKLLRTSYDHLKPGGWLELQEIHHYPMSTNNTLASDHPVAQYWQCVDQGLINLGVSFRTSNEGRIAAAMRECGYVNVTERVFHIPIGTWPKNKTLKSVGLYWKTILLDGIQAIALGPMTRGLHWRREQVEALLVSVRKGYHDNSLLLYMPLVCVYGQKPESQ